MIVRVKRTPDGFPDPGYVALHRQENGEWVPIAGQLAPNPELAMRICAGELAQQLDELGELIAQHMAALEGDLARLLDYPDAGDPVRIFGRLCPVDDEGSIVLPEQLRLVGPPWPAIDVHIGESLFQLLRQTVKLKGMNRSAAVETIVCSILNEPLNLLVAVEKAAPKMLAEMADLMVRVQERERAAESAKSTTPPGNGHAVS